MAVQFKFLNRNPQAAGNAFARGVAQDAHRRTKKKGGPRWTALFRRRVELKVWFF
jgi:hypothetical protein